MSIRRRLETLEGQISDSDNADRSEARARMKFHLDQIGRLRRGELDSEEAAESGGPHCRLRMQDGTEAGEGGR